MNTATSEKHAQLPVNEMISESQKHIEVFNFLNHQKNASENSQAHSEKKAQHS